MTSTNNFTSFFFLVLGLNNWNRRTLEESRIWIADSSSKMFPSDEDSVSRILSSISFSCFLLAALCTINAFLSSSNSGLFGVKAKKCPLQPNNTEDHRDQLVFLQRQKLIGFISRKRNVTANNLAIGIASPKDQHSLNEMTTHRSLATTIPSNWSSRPSGVIMKFNKVTCKMDDTTHRCVL